MDELRLILIIAGAALVVGVYLAGLLRGKAEHPQADRLRDDIELDEAGSIPILQDKITNLDSLISRHGEELIATREDASAGDGYQRELDAMGDLIAERDSHDDATDYASEVRGMTASRASKHAPVEQGQLDFEFAEPEKVIAVNVAAKPGQQLYGDEIRTAAASAGLLHGDMQIFHYMKPQVSTRRAVFSMANMVEPGFFDIARLDSLTTPGLTLFMCLPNPIDATEAYDIMLDVARQLARELDGKLLDGTRSVLTQMAIELQREELRAYKLGMHV